MKTIVVRNLFSYEYDGSNPSLPTIKDESIAIAMGLFFCKNKKKTIYVNLKMWYNYVDLLGNGKTGRNKQ